MVGFSVGNRYATIQCPSERAEYTQKLNMIFFFLELMAELTFDPPDVKAVP